MRHEKPRWKRTQLSARDPLPSTLRTVRDLAHAVFHWSGAVEVEVLPKKPEPGHATVRVKGAASLPYLERRLTAASEGKVHAEALDA